MPRGLFITLEGLDGSGKTTQMRRLAAWLKKRLPDEEPVITRQPGGTATGDRIRALVLDSQQTGLAPMTEMALMFADRAQAIAEVIELERARRRNQRTAEQNGPDESRFEAEQDAFYQRVWQKYREIAARESSRVVLIEGELDIDQVHEKIVEAVAARLMAANLETGSL